MLGAWDTESGLRRFVINIGKCFNFMFDREVYYAANRTLDGSWTVGPEPRVIVDRFDGTIYVTPNPHSKITVSLDLHNANRISQAEADKAVEVGFDAIQTKGDDTIRMTVRPNRPHRVSCHLNLSVPDGADLDLHLGSGAILIGPDQGTSAATSLSPASIKARTDGFRSLSVDIKSRIPEATRLDLECNELSLTVDGVRVDPGTPIKDSGPGGEQRWHFLSK